MNKLVLTPHQIRYLADDVRQSGIIQYLVGPESHPELIRLSYNIGSFLVVNKCPLTEILDAIWQPLTDDKKDPRIVQAVIRMVLEFLSHMDYPTVVDVCRRTANIPFSSYDASMVDFIQCLIGVTTKQFSDVSRADDMGKRPVSARH